MIKKNVTFYQYKILKVIPNPLLNTLKFVRMTGQ